MPDFKPLTELTNNRRSVEDVIGKLRTTNATDSLAAGQNMIGAAKEYGVSLSDYLRLAVQPEGLALEAGLDGYEATKVYLGLPTRNDFSNGITLQAAADSFASFRGVRALFPEVIDDIVRWKYRQTEFETAEAFISQSRTINGTELISTLVSDTKDDYGRYGMIGEGARIPMWSIKASEHSVKIFKFGAGLEWTYEFARRASLDLITPYVERMRKEINVAKAGTAYSVIKNGDAVHAAAPVTTATALKALYPTITAPVAGVLNWEVLLAWLVDRAKQGLPIDTVAGNWDMYLQWKMMFAKPRETDGITQIEALQRAGISLAREVPSFDMNINFALSSDATAAQLLGFSKNDTLEELVESGSDIEESERVMQNQKVNYYHTENKGYRLIFGDTRSVLSLNA